MVTVTSKLTLKAFLILADTCRDIKNRYEACKVFEDVRSSWEPGFSSAGRYPTAGADAKTTIIWRIPEGRQQIDQSSSQNQATATCGTPHLPASPKKESHKFYRSHITLSMG